MIQGQKEIHGRAMIVTVTMITIILMIIIMIIITTAINGILIVIINHSYCTYIVNGSEKRISCSQF